jgi:hypothetical protein
MRLFYCLFIALFTVGCSTPTTPTPTPTPTTTLPFHFDLPSGWTENSKTMEGRSDLYAIQSADGQGKAFGMTFDLAAETSDTEKVYDGLAPGLVDFLVGFEKAMPSRFEGWNLVRRGGVKFQDQYVGEIVFTGRDTMKTDKSERWRRILVMYGPGDQDRLILLGFGAPIGHEGDYREAFQAIEKSWRWK